jgi:uncharacterized membrane protein YesL
MAMIVAGDEDPLVAGYGGLIYGALGLGVTMPLASVGVASLVQRLIDTRDGSLVDFVSGMKRYGPKAVLLGIGYLLAAAILATSVWFYGTRLSESVPWLGYGLSAVALWCLAFEACTAMLVMPALVQKKGALRESVKMPALLVLANPGLIIGLTLSIAAWTVFCVVVTPLLFVLYGSVLIVMTSCAYEMLARKYAQLALDKAEAEQGAEAREQLARDPRFRALDDEDDDYLNRGFRDFLFPWKG